MFVATLKYTSNVGFAKFTPFTYSSKNFYNNHTFARYYSNTPNDRKYAKTHEWIKVVGTEGTIGITDFAQKSLGDVVYVDLPSIGKPIKAHGSVGAIESVKAASDVYSPVAGKISGVNENLDQVPSLINLSPYDKGWVAKVKSDDINDLKNMMDAGAYDKFVSENKH